MEVILLLVLGTVVGGALGAKVAGFDAWRGAVAVAGASVITLIVQIFFGVDNRLIDILVFLVAVGVLGGAVKLPGRALSSVVLGAFLVAAVIAGLAGGALSQSAGGSAQKVRENDTSSASDAGGAQSLARNVVGLTHINQALGERVTYRELRSQMLFRLDVPQGAWSIPETWTEVICFADGNNAVFFTLGDRFIAANGKARQFVRHDEGDGIMLANDEVARVEELAAGTHVELIHAVIEEGRALCGQKSLDEISEAVIEGAEPSSAASSPPDASSDEDAVLNAALAIIGADICGYEFDAVAMGHYLIDNGFDSETFAAQAQPYFVLANGILSATGDTKFCEKDFLPKFGPTGLAVVSK